MPDQDLQPLGQVSSVLGGMGQRRVGLCVRVSGTGGESGLGGGEGLCIS